MLISQPSATFTATNAKQFYVSVSRGKESATTYTDDRVALEYASEIGDRQSAIELVGNRLAHIDMVHYMERDHDDFAKVQQQAQDNLNSKSKDLDYEPEL